MEEENKIVDFNNFRQGRLAKTQEETPDTTKKIEKRNRVKKSDVMLMVGVALLFDGIQALFLLIPLLGWILSSLLSIFAWLTFYLWSSIKGWGLSDSAKQFLVQWAIPFVEVIPVLNALPTWTLKVVLQISFLKAEDAIYNASGGRADLEKLERLYKKVA